MEMKNFDKSEIFEGNQLIAKFLNYSKGCDLDDCLCYHKSWDWLMPVVEFIETTEFQLPEKYRKGIFKNDTTAFVELITFFDRREEFAGWTSHVSFVFGNTLFDYNECYNSKLTATWSAIVKFINWFNKNINHEK